jgi:DNA polymerase III subunit alpha
LPPDINESFSDFSVVPGKQTIRFGLTTIKNFGEGISEAITTERKEHGRFTSLQDFLTRIKSRNLNKKSLEALIMVGAFDVFGARGYLLTNVDRMLAFHREQIASAESAQDSLFGFGGGSVSDLTLEDAPDASTAQKLIWEKDLLGVYVSGHPLDDYTAELKSRPSIADIRSDSRNGIPVVTAGMVASVRELLTKKGDKMAFIILADQKDQIEMVAFPEAYAAQKDILLPGSCVAVKGRLSIRNDEPTIALERAKAFGAASNPAAA